MSRRLREALREAKDQLGPDSQRRIETNPLRVLDSKSPDEQPIIEKLPRIAEHLCDACHDHYAELKRQLALRHITYQENWRLVRGLDYYMRTTFEVTATGLGSQDAVCGGGRYDGLVEQLGGCLCAQTKRVNPAGGTPALPNPVAAPACDQCGALLTEEDFVAAEMVTIPAAQTRLRVPNGQEVITIVGGLELKTPPWAGEMHEYPYVQWNMEVHQARLRAAYPHAADKIGSPVAGNMQEYERLARLAQSQGGPLTEGGDFNINLITFQRTWLRPWASSRSKINPCATSCSNFSPTARPSRLLVKRIANRATKIWTITGA